MVVKIVSVCFFFTEDIEISATADWVIINPKQYGFYRVNYPEEYWQKLIAQQENDHTVSGCVQDNYCVMSCIAYVLYSACVVQ